MEGPGIVSLSGQVALQKLLEVTANNIANLNTTAYRGDRTLFQSHVSRLAVPGRDVAFVQDRATYVDVRQGSIAATGNPLDVAIDGEAFLAVERPANGGRAYTRDGRLHIGPDNRLVDNSGRPILDEGGAPILLPERVSAIEIRADGTILGTVDGRVEQAGRIGRFTTTDIRAARKAGDGLIDIPANAVQPVPQEARNIRLVQGALESSTVQAVSEIANLAALQRAYESMQRIVLDDDSRLRKMIDTLGRQN